MYTIRSEASKRSPLAAGRDRRRHERLAFPSWVVVRGEGIDNPYLFTKDVSSSGIFVISGRCPRIGTEVSVEILLGGGQRCLVGGVVARSVEAGRGAPAGSLPGFAVEFRGLSESRAADLMRRIERALALSGMLEA